MKLIRFFIFSAFALFFKLGFTQVNQQTNIIDFSDVDFNDKIEVKLDSGFVFYWKAFILPNEFLDKKPTAIVSAKSWDNYTDINGEQITSLGYGTYRVKIKIPKDRPTLSLRVPRLRSAYKLWINGKLIKVMGKIGTSKEETLHRRFSQVFPLNSNETDFDIVFQISNFYNRYGGITQPLLIGKTENLYLKKSVQITADMILIGSLSFVGFFFLLFYIFYWNKDTAILYFSIMCLSIAYHTSNDRYAPLSGIFDDISWIFLTKVEYLSLHAAGIAASLFLCKILSEFNHKIYLKIVIPVISLLAIAIIFAPSPTFTYIIDYFLIAMLINGGYAVVTSIRAILAKNKASFLLLTSMVIGASVFLGHIFFFLSENEFALIYIKFGYVASFLLLSMLLMVRFSNSFEQLENSKKKVLSQQQEILAQSERIFDANEKLEGNLDMLENYNKELNDFNHIVSHDLKTPLISVFSLVSFIEEDLEPVLTTETKYHLKLLKDVVSKMEGSIKALLKYSKTAKGDKRSEWFSLNKLLEKVITLVDSQNKCEINILEKDVKVFANKLELEHVFLNLMSNSIKYNDKDKTVISIKLVENPGEYFFSVIDNGPGVDKKYHAKIFEIFSQLNENKEDDFESSGIGLAIVKKIIRKNYGDVFVDSEKGKGLTVNFTWRMPNLS